MHILKQSELDGMPCPDTLIHGECLAAMNHIADGSIDAIICDLPYGATCLKWDSVIPFEPLWEAYKRVIKPGGAIVLFGSQPFTSALVMSNPEMFKYAWIWQKEKPTGFLNANFRPMQITEDIAVFSSGGISSRSWVKGTMAYYPVGTTSVSIAKKNNPNCTWRKNKGYPATGNKLNSTAEYQQTKTGYPNNILRFSRDVNLIHPTQKPVALLEYLIRTYSNPGELVLDNTMGSATLPVACLNTGRRFIGIELDDTYFAAGCARVRARETELALTLSY